jgi:hypothetical protein
VEVGKHVGQVVEDAMCGEGRGKSEARDTVAGAELEEMERATRGRVGVGMRCGDETPVGILFGSIDTFFTVYVLKNSHYVGVGA